MVKRGADTIVLASWIFKGTPIGFPCPHAQEMKDAIVRKLGDTVKIINWGFVITHNIPYFTIILDKKAYFAKNFS